MVSVPHGAEQFLKLLKDTVSSTPDLCITCLLCLNSLLACLQTFMCHALCGFCSPGKARGSFLVLPRLCGVACDLHPSHVLRDLAFLQAQPKGHDSLSLTNSVLGQIQRQPRPGLELTSHMTEDILLMIFRTVDLIFPRSHLFFSVGPALMRLVRWRRGPTFPGLLSGTATLEKPFPLNLSFSICKVLLASHDAQLSAESKWP